MFKKSVNRWLFTMMLVFCIMLSVTSAAFANTLNIDYNSGDERKIVITGPLLTADQERVFSESELKQLFATDKVNGDLYHFTMLNTVGSKRAYTLRGVSMLDVFEYCGIGTGIYRNPDYFLQVVCSDGFVATMGPGVTFTGQGGITEAGTLDAARYSYSYQDGGRWAVTYDFVAANLKDDIIEEAVGREVPWLIVFAESEHTVSDGLTGQVGDPYFPIDATETIQAFRPYFGQLHVENPNLPFSGDNTYRLVFAEEKIGINDVYNIPAAGVFSLGGTMYDRASILTGCRKLPQEGVKGVTFGQKVKGSFDDGSGNVAFFEGTTVTSLLILGLSWQNIGGVWQEAPVYVITAGQYASFENAAGENVIVSYEDILADNYILVYRTGSTANTTTAIEREVGGKKYYFDLYRDGAPVVQNISGISPVQNPMFTVTFDADNGSQAVIITVAGNAVVAELQNPEKTGYQFLGWALNGAAYDFNSPVTRNIVLVAQWKKNAPMLGDVDGNKEIDFADALIVINHYLERSMITGADALLAADVDGNKEIDFADALMIINHYLERAFIE